MKRRHEQVSGYGPGYTTGTGKPKKKQMKKQTEKESIRYVHVM